MRGYLNKCKASSLMNSCTCTVSRIFKFSQMIGEQRHFRFLEKDFDIPAVLALFGNNICLISKDNNKIKIVIVEDELMFKITHFLFEHMWVSLSK